MPLSKEEQATLDRLMEKSKEPDDDSPKRKNGRNEQVQIIVDLSDEKATNRAIALGILTESDLIEGADDEVDDDVDDDEETEGKPKRKAKAKPDSDDEEEAPPKRRRGYFKEEAE